MLQRLQQLSTPSPETATAAGVSAPPAAAGHTAYIEQLDWAVCMARYNRAHTLFYLDPPY
ncbi:hypothetical protein F7R26_011240 [Cupriavidus basilensis]|uniref:DNA adenine methylase n=1 Tax=Cupriavidus basilensis TaxID=68895 RepID=A0A643G3S3_9BURK|nr:hypothetical protein F7R26_011240 [Cupriavidus basilensis]